MPIDPFLQYLDRPQSGRLGILRGTFDLYHWRHAEALRTRRAACDRLWVVTVTEPGGREPVFSDRERAEMMGYVDGVDAAAAERDLPPNFYEDLARAAGGAGVSVGIEGLEGLAGAPAGLSAAGADWAGGTGWSEVSATEMLVERILGGQGANPESVPPLSLRVWPESDAAALAEGLKARGEEVATTNGSFDILHPGHLRYLEQARGSGKLLVLVNDDESVRARKGGNRPLLNQAERMAALAGLKCLDFVVPFRGDNPLYLLEEIRPDRHVKGGSFEEARVAEEKRVVEAGGGRWEALPLEEGFSSSAALGRLVERGRPPS